MSFPHFVHKFPSGMRLVVVPDDRVESVLVSAIARAGAIFETDEIDGLSHFVEHMAFKGGKKFPTQKAAMSYLDEVGGMQNASTGHEKIMFYSRLPAKHVRRAFEVISDMMFEPAFPEKDLEIERGNVIEEIKMYADQPQDLVGQDFQSHLFGRGGLGRTVLGPEENIRRLARQDFKNYAARFFHPGNLTLAVGGKITPDAAQKFAEEFFEKPDPAGAENYPALEKFTPADKIFIREQKTNQAHLVLGHEIAVGQDDPRWPALRLANAVLAGGASARLFDEIREKRGLAYYVGSAPGMYAGTAEFAVFAGVNLEKVPAALDGIREVLARPITEDEFRRAREGALGRLAMAHESAAGIAQDYVLDLVHFDEIETLETWRDRIAAVTLAEARAAQDEFFQTEKMRLAAIGPFGEKDREAWRAAIS